MNKIDKIALRVAEKLDPVAWMHTDPQGGAMFFCKNHSWGIPLVCLSDVLAARADLEQRVADAIKQMARDKPSNLEFFAALDADEWREYL